MYAIATLCTLWLPLCQYLCWKGGKYTEDEDTFKCLHIIKKGGEAGIVVAFVYMRVFTYVHVYLEHMLYQ
jgi:hypothetical protein